ncbi:Putative cytoplasmic protein [Fimbriimonas ginsengisoli Gsoil 348]|uniref:Putative cytoplasmic protein n=2 Tax=Fimbriimonas ginsengisoli TaxID=1005039 RepID=A0A068NYS5_FIMGI|nr:Putative cytoplasmic protein [Fimbriimonas ginsengisoli Gsoil 348]
MEAFERLRSIQFDPIAPIGCNHDLVLQARVPGYRIGDWEKTAYEDRQIYDGWDKQASLVPFEGWPWRRIFHKWHRGHFQKIFEEFPEAVTAILKDLEERGPLMPKECGFQEKKAEWKSHWSSPNVTKRVLRALWHTGQVMTAGRRKGQHLYDLAERLVPAHLYRLPMMEDEDAVRELVAERHRAVGLLRFSAPMELWSYKVYAGPRAAAIERLIEMGELVPVDVEGIKAHATPQLLSNLDSPSPAPRVTFVAPLDQLLWDRKMVAHLFDFDYAWEIYIPEAKRRWGYYVLPVLFGDAMVARAEFWCRDGVLEVRSWHFEPGDPGPSFLIELERALQDLMAYCSAVKIVTGPGVDPIIRDLT